MRMNKILFIDMDGVLVDLEKHYKAYFKNNPEQFKIFKNNPDLISGIFRNPPPIKNAIASVKKLYNSNKYDMYIASTAPFDNVDSLTDKRVWIETHFGDIFYKKIFFTHRKDMLIGDYLIDDRTANGAGDFKGELISFGYNWETNKINEYPDWDAVLNKLL